MSPLVTLIALLSFAVLVLGFLWLAGPWKPRGPHAGAERSSFRRSSVHPWGHEESTRELR